MFFTPERIFLLCCLGGGYIFGLIQTAFFISKAKHKDLRYHGSGNLGTTNAWRVLGAGYGILTFIGDLVKTAAAIFLAMYIYQKFFMTSLSIDFHAVVLFTGVGVVLGHDFPVYLKFKGGKGIACTFATIVCLQDLKLIAVAVLVFLIIFLVFRYVSVASLLMVFFSAVAFMFFMIMRWTFVPDNWVMDCEVGLAVLFILALLAHTPNLIRLAYGEENKFLFRKRLRQEQQEEDYTDFDKYYEENMPAATEETLEAAQEGAEAVAEAVEETKEAVEEAVEEFAETVEEVAEEVTEEAAEAAETAEETIEEIAEAADTTETVEETTEEITEETVEETTEEITEETVEETTEEIVEEAAETVEETVEEVTEEFAEEVEEAAETVENVKTNSGKNKSGKKNKSSKKNDSNGMDKRKQRRLNKKAKREQQK